MQNTSTLLLITGLLASCVGHPGASACSKDYAALKAREMEIIDRGIAIEDKVREQDYTPEQRAAVAESEALLSSRARIVDEKDIQIVDHARALLREPSTWDRADDRQCHEGDTTFSLYCALYFASREATGEYQHRRTALEEVRSVVEDATKGRDYAHRLRDYNNDLTTQLRDIHHVLAVARTHLVKRLNEQRRCKV